MVKLSRENIEVKHHWSRLTGIGYTHHKVDIHTEFMLGGNTIRMTYATGLRFENLNYDHPSNNIDFYMSDCYLINELMSPQKLKFSSEAHALWLDGLLERFKEKYSIKNREELFDLHNSLLEEGSFIKHYYETEVRTELDLESMES